MHDEYYFLSKVDLTIAVRILINSLQSFIVSSPFSKGIYSLSCINYSQYSVSLASFNAIFILAPKSASL